MTGGAIQLANLPGSTTRPISEATKARSVSEGSHSSWRAAHSALLSVGLEGYEDVPLRQLSAGQKKRAALARLLLVPAALWLLDEPYANLDREGIELVNRLLETHAHRGGAALVTSHGAYAYTSGAPRRLALRPEARA